MTGWFLLVAILGGLGLLWWIMQQAARRPRFGERERAIILDRWQYIEELMIKNRNKEAVLEADKLLDFAFKEMRLKGESFADRLRSAKNILPNYQDIWVAHKLRNQLVHEISAEANPREAETALNTFKQALRHIKAL